ncbi:putative Sterol uptake control protein 2 [Seiridium unicorne]|uniref:Sterol uptake control protein 2 n=1 Tax=Seiridium unicorne TaxID=138068 RepID=A0ABR2UV23_9PEZI
MEMKRLGYRKSRTGCAHCKQRRVKCDEVRPTCGACRKHKLTCNLDSVVPHHKSALDTRSRFPRVQSLSTPLPNQTKYSPGYKRDAESNSQSGDNLISDAELIHHWTISTYQTISTRPEVQDVIQKEVPKEAFRHKFLLHQILALTGYHIAYSNHSQRLIYHLKCSQHQEQALSGLTQALPDAITDVNCHAVYLASVFLALTAFSSFPAYERFNHSFSLIENLMDIFILINGTKTVVQSGKQYLHQGPFKALSGGTVVKQASHENTAMEDVMQALTIAKKRIEDPQWEPDLCNDHDMRHLSSGFLKLSAMIEDSTVTNGNASTAEYMTAIVWPMMLSSEMIAWLRLEPPAALLLLSYYASVLSIAGDDFWFFEGWGEALAIYIMKRLEVTKWAKLLPNNTLANYS